MDLLELEGRRVIWTVEVVWYLQDTKRFKRVVMAKNREEAKTRAVTDYGRTDIVSEPVLRLEGLPCLHCNQFDVFNNTYCDCLEGCLEDMEAYENG